MGKLQNPPCIRGLKKFEKSGCPRKPWDGVSGCMAWITQFYDHEDKTKDPIQVSACLDQINFDIQLKMLRLLEGNQQATEGLRNGLCEVRNGKTEPKPDPMLEQFMCIVSAINNRKLLQED